MFFRKLVFRISEFESRTTRFFRSTNLYKKIEETFLKMNFAELKKTLSRFFEINLPQKIKPAKFQPNFAGFYQKKSVFIASV